MSPSAVEPGTKLAERFRLEDRVHESGGATLWKAIDEVLARPVAVHTFDPDFPRLIEVVTAARVASRLTDPRLTQVFDATEDDGHSYVVSEWVSGEDFSDMIAGGPLDPERAASLVAEAAEAMAHAHEANLAHLCLTPEHLVWTAGGTVKLLGLGIDAVLVDVTSDDPARTDTEGLGRLLYAGLTGHWPGDEQDSGGLPVAPMDDGHFCTPRQVTAGVPGYLDTIVCRAMLPESKRGLDPLTTPAELAEALASVSRPAPLPMPTPMPMAPLPVASSRSEGLDIAAPSRDGMSSPTQHQHQRQTRQTGGGLLSKIAMTVVVLLAMTAVGLGAWTLGRSFGNAGGPSAGESTASASPSAPAAATGTREVKPKSVSGFDPLGDGPEGDAHTQNAIDGKSSTDWHTETYNNTPDFGGLKDGAGLLLDMGESVPIRQVSIEFGGTPGGTAELRLGDAKDLNELAVTGKPTDAVGKKEFSFGTAQKSRYVLIWFTKLPPFERGFRGSVLDVKILATK
ncbi:Protein kinase domain-containing protein [Streptosporangium subroseum]|uniref:Protein kinase domain-containing protein n=1 Tax=Streptosporangium subroseum TaxID=106412 RepID=A0A239NY79_9ACTN|nr:protein kinase family protein [Streptosporangium subroseum]SNT59710.1 Protein kinase domain-containing protein [Streptosporangium subroseum]